MTNLKPFHRFTDNCIIYVNMNKVVYINATPTHGTKLATDTMTIYVKESPSEVTNG